MRYDMERLKYTKVCQHYWLTQILILYTLRHLPVQIKNMHYRRYKPESPYTWKNRWQCHSRKLERCTMQLNKREYPYLWLFIVGHYPIFHRLNNGSMRGKSVKY